MRVIEEAKLLGKYVTEIYTNSDQSELYLVNNKYAHNVIYKITTDADCCSETWFADIIGVENLIGKEVVGVEIKDWLEPQDDRSRQESDIAYGFTLKTSKGCCDFVYRNSSNGYYGGSLNSIEECKKLPEGLTKITTDWSA